MPPSPPEDATVTVETETGGFRALKVPAGVDRPLFRSVLLAYQAAFKVHGRQPTLKQVHGQWPRVTQKVMGEVIGSDEFVDALKILGIEIDRHGGLTDEQNLVIAALSDPYDKRSIAARLKAVGVPMGRYLNWQRNPLFAAALEYNSSGAYMEALPALRNRLIEKAESGDMRAIELIFAKTGEFDPAAQSLEDARTFVLKVIESVMRHVRSEDERQAILADVRAYGVALGAAKAQISA